MGGSAIENTRLLEIGERAVEHLQYAQKAEEESSDISLF